MRVLVGQFTDSPLAVRLIGKGPMQEEWNGETVTVEAVTHGGEEEAIQVVDIGPWIPGADYNRMAEAVAKVASVLWDEGYKLGVRRGKAEGIDEALRYSLDK